MSTTMEQEQLDLEIERGVLEAYRTEGYVKTTEDDEEVVDKTALHEAIYRAVREARVNTLKERPDKSLTKGALTQRVFPNAAAVNATWEELGEVEQGVWEQLVKDAWNPTNPNFSGPVQRMVGDRDDKLILIRTKTALDGTPDQDIVYVTASEELIFTDFVGPLKNSVRRTAEKLAKNSAMISTRNKQLSERAGREVDSGMKNASQLAKSTLALMSGASES